MSDRVEEIRALRRSVLHRETVDFQRSEIDSPKVDEALAAGKHVRWLRGSEYIGTTIAGGTYQIFTGEDVDTLLAALDGRLKDLVGARAHAEKAERERDARPAITAEDAAGWDRDRNTRRNDDTWRQDREAREQVEDALRAHAAKANGGDT